MLVLTGLCIYGIGVLVGLALVLRHVKHGSSHFEACFGTLYLKYRPEYYSWWVPLVVTFEPSELEVNNSFGGAGNLLLC